MSEMSSFKMHFGSHSHSHQWMNKLSKKHMIRNFKINKILKKNNDKNNFTSFTFPNGGYNKNTLSILNDLKNKICIYRSVRWIE